MANIWLSTSLSENTRRKRLLKVRLTEDYDQIFESLNVAVKLKILEPFFKGNIPEFVLVYKPESEAESGTYLGTDLVEGDDLEGMLEKFPLGDGVRIIVNNLTDSREWSPNKQVFNVSNGSIASSNSKVEDYLRRHVYAPTDLFAKPDLKIQHSSPSIRKKFKSESSSPIVYPIVAPVLYSDLCNIRSTAIDQCQINASSTKVECAECAEDVRYPHVFQQVGESECGFDKHNFEDNIKAYIQTELSPETEISQTNIITQPVISLSGVKPRNDTVSGALNYSEVSYNYGTTPNTASSFGIASPVFGAAYRSNEVANDSNSLVKQGNIYNEHGYKTLLTLLSDVNANHNSDVPESPLGMLVQHNGLSYNIEGYSYSDIVDNFSGTKRCTVVVTGTFQRSYPRPVSIDVHAFDELTYRALKRLDMCPYGRLSKINIKTKFARNRGKNTNNNNTADIQKCQSITNESPGDDKSSQSPRNPLIERMYDTEQFIGPLTGNPLLDKGSFSKTSQNTAPELSFPAVNVSTNTEDLAQKVVVFGIKKKFWAMEVTADIEQFKSRLKYCMLHRTGSKSHAQFENIYISAHINGHSFCKNLAGHDSVKKFLETVKWGDIVAVFVRRSTKAPRREETFSLSCFLLHQDETLAPPVIQKNIKHSREVFVRLFGSSKDVTLEGIKCPLCGRRIFNETNGGASYFLKHISNIHRNDKRGVAITKAFRDSKRKRSIAKK